MEEKKQQVYTIELNLDDNPMGSCSWHIDCYKKTMKRNIEHSIKKINAGRWVLVGLTNTIDEAWDYVDKIQKLIAEQMNKDLPFDKQIKPYCTISKWFDEQEESGKNPKTK